MRVGDKVVRTPLTFGECIDGQKDARRSMTGRVVYIHPRGRYHTVEFALRGGTVRESFLGAVMGG